MRKWHGYSSRPQRVEVAVVLRQGPPGGEFPRYRRFSRLGVVWLGVGCIVLLLAMQWWQRQPVREIRWSGLQHLSPEELLSRLPSASGHAVPDLEQWRQALLRHPLITGVALYWEAPGILHIAIEERRLLAVVAQAERFLCLDAEGKLWELPRELVRERLPRVELPQLSQEQRAECVRLLQSVPRDSVSALRWEPSRGWVLHLRGGSVLWVGDTAALEAKWRRWSRFREHVALPGSAVVDLRWSGLVAVQPPVPQPPPVP
jgi:cell division septal protein FtsQ